MDVGDLSLALTYDNGPGPSSERLLGVRDGTVDAVARSCAGIVSSRPRHVTVTESATESATDSHADAIPCR